MSVKGIYVRSRCTISSNLRKGFQTNMKMLTQTILNLSHRMCTEIVYVCIKMHAATHTLGFSCNLLDNETPVH